MNRSGFYKNCQQLSKNQQAIPAWGSFPSAKAKDIHMGWIEDANQHTGCLPRTILEWPALPNSWWRRKIKALQSACRHDSWTRIIRHPCLIRNHAMHQLAEWIRHQSRRLPRYGPGTDRLLDDAFQNVEPWRTHHATAAHDPSENGSRVWAPASQQAIIEDQAR